MYIWVPTESKRKRALDAPGARVTKSCEPSSVGTENQTPVLWSSNKYS